MSEKTAHELLEDDDFKSLSRRRNVISWTLTLLELLVYFGFIALIAFNKPFLARKLADGEATTIGIPIAVLTIVLSWAFTGIYIVWANTRYDSQVRKMKDRIGA